MTEREKMLAGLPYDCSDPQLLARWHLAKDLARAYNQLPSADLEAKQRLLRQLLGGFGSQLWIAQPFYVDYGENIYFGDGCEVNMNCTFQDDQRITIGDRALIGPNVQIYTASHALAGAARRGAGRGPGFSFCTTQAAPVTVGSDVWIGGGAILLPGVTVGDDVVIGAGSVVTRPLPSHVVACGNPCRVVRRN